ncbi:MAG: hypothetical protein HY261_06515 [Chloroflexi bacterium]|nr:hypothetical protein [Chloroflexota bacterium]
MNPTQYRLEHATSGDTLVAALQAHLPTEAIALGHRDWVIARGGKWSFRMLRVNPVPLSTRLLRLPLNSAKWLIEAIASSLYRQRRIDMTMMTQPLAAMYVLEKDGRLVQPNVGRLSDSNFAALTDESHESRLHRLVEDGKADYLAVAAQPKGDGCELLIEARGANAAALAERLAAWAEKARDGEVQQMSRRVPSSPNP